MKTQHVAVRPHIYRAELTNADVDSHILAEDSTLRGVVTKLNALPLSSIADVSIQTEIEGWALPPGVPRQVYAYAQKNHWRLLPVESVPEHWDFPAPDVYFALDWVSGIYLEAPSLSSLVDELRRTGGSFVRSKDMKIGARFVREDIPADDVVQVPLSLICHEYDPYGDDVIIVDKGWDKVTKDMTAPCSPLPLEAELLPPDMVEPHFLFGDILVRQRRLKVLL